MRYRGLNPPTRDPQMEDSMVIRTVTVKEWSEEVHSWRTRLSQERAAQLGSQHIPQRQRRRSQGEARGQALSLPNLPAWRPPAFIPGSCKEADTHLDQVTS
ncbi:hypothetical protein GRJ2_001425100 [Grus japonensis]|uniref:Uncharacterized protein n=1 Tax=Grus japonensis TaxID=30415 RepID=A0ABC9WVX4_GRUJA